METTEKKNNRRREPGSGSGSESEYDQPPRSKCRMSSGTSGIGSGARHLETEFLETDQVIIESLKRFNAAKTSPSQSQNSYPLSFPCPEVSDIGVGVVIGRLFYSEAEKRVNCSGLGRVIPLRMDRVSDFKSDALFILLVENESALFRLTEDRFYDRIPCVIITSYQHVDVGTRLFLNKMKTELKLPVFALVDCNPNGLKILLRYMCGSTKDRASNLTTPDIKWLGMRPSDLENYQLPNYSRIRMNKQDVQMVHDLLEEDFVKRNPSWVEELSVMVTKQQSAEIEALGSHAIAYLSEIYLPHKLQKQDWL